MENRLTYLPQLDGLRACAFLSVFAMHTVGGVFWGGWLGVDMFFVLSGYLITAILRAEYDATGGINKARFYWRRFARLAPALLAVAGVWAIQRAWHGLPTARPLAAVLLYCANWTRAFRWEVGLDALAHTWSLGVEEQFYLLWSPALLVALRSRRPALLVAIGIIVVNFWRWGLLAAGAPIERLYNGFDTRADSLLCGCLLALLPQAVRAKQPAWLAWASILFLCGCGMRLTFTLPIVYLAGFPLIACGSALVINEATIAPGGALSHSLRLPSLVWLGRLSYSAYLWHLPIIAARLWPANWWLGWRTLLDLSLTLAVASLSFYLVERPARARLSSLSCFDTSAQVLPNTPAPGKQIEG